MNIIYVYLGSYVISYKYKFTAYVMGSFLETLTSLGNLYDLRIFQHSY